MKKKVLIFSIVILFSAKVLYTQSYNQVDSSSNEYTIVWQDEFNGNKIDTNKWVFYNEEDPNWNGELQYYTSRKENCYLNNGKLHLVARNESYTFNGETREYTSAKLRTKGKADWKYGKVEVRAKMPIAGNGIWPAIWMMPSKNKYGTWPNSGEIDIMEYVGFMPFTIHGTIHTKAYNHIDGTQKGSTIEIPSVSTKFHNYSIEWNEKFIEFAVDGNVYYKFNNEHRTWKEWPFDNNFYLILNLAVGGSLGGKEGIDNTIFPEIMEIDFVRVYQKDN